LYTPCNTFLRILKSFPNDFVVSRRSFIVQPTDTGRATSILTGSYHIVKMRLIPFEVMAKWPAPNYDNPETRGPDVVILNSVLIFVVTLIVMLRLYVRVFLLRRWGFDDFFIILALVSKVSSR
jgi:hypothetical protein